MNHEADSKQGGGGRAAGSPTGGPFGGARVIPAAALLVVGLVLGVMGDALLRAPGPLGLNMFLCVAAVALAAYGLQRRAGLALDHERFAWLGVAVLFAAGLAWRDSTSLKPLALACATVGFALAAYRAETPQAGSGRSAAAWVRRAGVFDYIGAWATGALHAWTASALVLLDATRLIPHPDAPGRTGWRRAAAVARGLVIATPLVLVFGALFMAADAVFNDLVLNIIRIDFELIASHLLLFAVCAWLGTGYLRGYVAGTELTTLRGLWGEQVDQFLKEAPMRATSSPQRSNVLAFVLAAALLGPSAAYAQPFLMHVGWQFHRELNTSFAVEMVLGPDGHLRGAITPQDPDTRVAGTHSALRATADRLHSTYGTRWQQLGTDGVLETRGDLTVKVSTTAAPCTACDPVFVIIGSSDRAPAAPGGGGDGGDAVVFNIVDSVASTALIIRIAGLPGQQLQGSPARYFNRPGPDEPLIATFQALGPGQNVEVVLKVLDANDPGAGATLIPVKIKHNL